MEPSLSIMKTKQCNATPVAGKARLTGLLAALALGVLVTTGYSQPVTNLFDNFETGVGQWTAFGSAAVPFAWSATTNKVPAGAGHSAFYTNNPLCRVVTNLSQNVSALPWKLTAYMYDNGSTRDWIEVRNYPGAADPATSGNQVIAIGKFNSTDHAR